MDKALFSSDPSKSSNKIPLSILVVDDDPLVRKAVGRTLEQLGHRVMLAASVQEALELADHSWPHLVFADFHLGEHQKTGLALIEALKERRPDTFVALMSGRIVSVSSTADLFLPKPLTMDAIALAIEAYLKQRAN
jgi:two-component system C4-dicarboxylate transport response regulator DctD